MSATKADSRNFPTGAGGSGRLHLRAATRDDIAAIVDLSERTYTAAFAYTEAFVASHLQRFPQGVFVADFDGKVVGYCASFRIAEGAALAAHSWHEITGGGYASRHDPNGDWLYGMEVCVDSAFRGQRIGRRLYDRRKRLCQELGLNGIVFGARMPGYKRRAREFPDPLDYARSVESGLVRDPTVTFQLRNGFRLIGVLRNYLPNDADSLGYAAHLVWRNPKVPMHPAQVAAAAKGELPDTVRVAVLQFQQREQQAAETFFQRIAHYVDVASAYRSDFLLLPEYVSLQLMADADHVLTPQELIEKSTSYTSRWRETLSSLAVRHNLNIVGGSHLDLRSDGSARSVCFVCLRDGSVHEQEKIHPTPVESDTLALRGGTRARVIPTDSGPIGVAICYDIEFPEVARHLADQGALILFVPFASDDERGFQRVRLCAHARAIENQCFVAMAGNVGQVANLRQLNLHYAKSCILTPCDYAFARDGLAAEANPDVESLTFADLHLDDLLVARSSGTVRQLEQRRFDLYRVAWR